MCCRCGLWIIWASDSRVSGVTLLKLYIYLANAGTLQILRKFISKSEGVVYIFPRTFYELYTLPILAIILHILSSLEL